LLSTLPGMIPRNGWIFGRLSLVANVIVLSNGTPDLAYALLPPQFT